MRKKLSHLLALLCLTLAGPSAWAQTTFQSGDFTYVVLDEEARTAALSRVPEAYRGAVVVPETVTNEGTTYTVTQIGSPASATDYYQSAFYYSTIESLTIPATVTKVTGSMFYYTVSDPAIQQVTIADSPNPITFDAIGYTEHIENLYIGRDIVYDNSLRTDPGTAVFVNTDHVVIGSQVTTLRDNMFSATGQYLVSIDLSQATSLTTLGTNVFYDTNNVGLTTIDLSKTKITSVPDNAFMYCDKLTTIKLPGTVQTIGHDAFNYCLALQDLTIPASVTSIGSQAFWYDTEMESLTIEDSDTPLVLEGDYGDGLPGKNSFYLGRDLVGAEGAALTNRIVFTNVKNVTVGPKVTTLPANAFSGAGAVESFDFSNATSLTTIGENVFYGCSNEKLTSIDLSKTKITSVPDNTFMYCDKLTTIKLPGTVQTIGHDAFNYCLALQDLTIPASVTSIGSQAFWYDTEMESLTIEDSDTPLVLEGDYGDGLPGKNSFYLGRDLVGAEGAALTNRIVFTNVKNVTVGPKVTTLPANAFSGAGAVESFDFSNATSLTTIGENVFYGCSNEKLTSIDLRNTKITAIPDGAFYYCSYLATPYLPNTVQSIGNQAFRWCQRLEEVTIPASVTTIGNEVFYNTDNIKSFTIEDGTTTLACGTIGDGFSGETFYLGRDVTYTSTASGQLIFTNVKNVTLGPNVTTLSNYMFARPNMETFDWSRATGITAVPDRCFDNCDGLRSFTIPANITTIEASAFWNMDAAITVTIEDSDTPLTLNCNGSYWAIFEANSSVNAYVGRNIVRTGSHVNQPTFDNSLVGLTFGPKVTAIGSYEYKDCSYIAGAVNGLENVVSIGEYAFNNCKSITSIEIGNKLETLGDYAFQDCQKLESISLPGTLKKIPTEAFENCFALATVTLAEGIEEIGNGAFYDTDALTEITIPASVKKIGRAPFYCNNAQAMKRMIILDSDTPLEFANGTSEYNWGRGNLSDDITLDYFYLGRDIMRVNTDYSLVADCKYIEIGPKVTNIDKLFDNVGDHSDNMVKNVKVNSLTPIAISVDPFHSNTYANATLWLPGGTKAAYQSADYWKNFENIDFSSFVVSISTTGHGTLAMADIEAGNGESEQTLIDRETDVTFTATADEGYELTAFTVNGEAQTLTNGQFTVTNLQADQAAAATYSPITYTLTYDLAGGSVQGTNSASYTIESETFTLTNPTREGYTFTGWTGTGLDGAQTMVTIAKGSTGNRSYTATWTPIIYNIVLTLDGGVAENPTTYTIESEAITLTNPTKTGYTFKGWKQNGEGEALMTVIIAKGSTGDKAYTATWQINQYTLTFNSNGGSVVTPITQDYGTDVEAPANPTRTGYTFTGWEPAVPTTIPAENMTFVAQWQINQYTITFDSNGGSAVTPITQDYATNVTAPANPTREGYTFAGWDKTIPTTMPAENTTVTASWTPIEYTISYDLAGGSVQGTNPATYTIESETITLVNPTKEYYDFVGWTGTALDGSPVKTVVIAQGSTGNRSYTATWTEKTYTVTITGAGVTVDKMTPKYGDDVVITIAEDEDRVLTSLTVNGTDVTAQVAGGQYTISGVNSNINVVATFSSTKEFITMAHPQGTFSCSQDLDFTGSELKAYIAAGYNKQTNTTLIVRVYDVPAGTGLLLKGIEGQTYKIPYAASQSYYVNLLKAQLEGGSISATTGEMRNYVLNQKDGVIGFYTPSATATLKAQSAYLQLPASFVTAETRVVKLLFEDEDVVTNIGDFEMFNVSNDRIYNLQGQPVKNPARGVYIINGKKRVIK